MGSWDERRFYVQALVSKVDIKQKKVASNVSRRKSSFLYRLKLEDGTSVQVCKPFFASTLGLSQRTVASWLNIHNDAPKDDNPHRPHKGKTAYVEKEDTGFLKQWLSGLPSLPSHYCRNSPTYKDKKFLYPGTTIAKLHVEYQAAAETAGNRVVCSTKFSEIFRQESYSVFIPRKDQCDLCVSAKHGNIDDAKYQAHIFAKDQAKKEKAADKNAANDEKLIWTMDMQAVLLCPRTKASTLYYKTKLQVHNFTLYII